MDNIVEALGTFSNAIQHQCSLPGSSSTEDQLKAPIAELIKTVGQQFKLDVSSTTEVHLSEYRVRPDMAIYVSSLICGYIELKQPGLGADAPKLREKHNKEQWEKLKNLPNLIYTDGREWALYRNGGRAGPLVRFLDDPATVGEQAIDEKSAEQFATVLRDFLYWKPHVPHRPREMAAFLAPLTRFLRSEVEQALATENSNVGLLAEEWRKYFFPDADDAQFSDAYAQTVTYALLLARMQGVETLEPQIAAKSLDKGNSVLALALDRLGQPEAKEELRVGFELLQRSLEALDPSEFQRSKPEMWLYFYEDFLAAYDPRLRKDYGVYYTPSEVVEFQVRFASELLETRFEKQLGFADEGVVFLDPAVGTGNYLVATVNHALKTVEERSGEGAVAGRASQMAENMYGFEILVGPYAVAHLRLSQVIEGVGGTLPNDGRVKLYLADTLESPNATPPGGLTLTYKALTQEHEAARKIKNDGEVLVCLGNPPYDRQQIEEGDTTTSRKGGWVRFSDQAEGGARQEEQGDPPILDDFTEPASKAGAGIHLKNLYNDYVYFWRWALWRLFEQQSGGGIVSFITASSYLAGPGFIGMREVMRRTFDELWIIDLGGDNLGTRKSPNVFNIQTPVAIAIGIRGDKALEDTPATVRYTKIVGDSRESKLEQLKSINELSAIEWRLCPDDWHKPFLPVGEGDFFDWPLLTDLFPWSHTGVQFKRSWPIGETKNVIKNRFDTLKVAAVSEKKILFKESRDREITYKTNANVPGGNSPSVYEIDQNYKCPELSTYAFRSFDKHFALIDVRFGDFLKPVLINTLSESQVFFTTLVADALADGPAVNATAFLPDLHHFCGRGGKDVLPLYRDAEAKIPNITNGMLDHLSKELGSSINIEEFVAYIYAILANQSYSSRFWNELETPGIRVPITKSQALFRRVAKLGRKLICLHTYGERFKPKTGKETTKPGKAKCRKAVSSNPDEYPDKFEYKATSKTIFFGDGEFGPVSPEVWNYEVSGLKVVRSWLSYRKKNRTGKKSSPLDDVRPKRWTPAMTDELLELLWVLEHTLSMEKDLSDVLTDVVSGDCFAASELPEPTEAERQPPKSIGEENSLLAMMGDGEDSDEDCTQS